MIAKARAGTSAVGHSYICPIHHLLGHSNRPQCAAPSQPTLRALASQQCGTVEAASPTPLGSSPTQSPPLPHKSIYIESTYLYQGSWSLCLLLDGEGNKCMGYRLTCSPSPWLQTSDQHFPLSVCPLNLSLYLPCLAKLKAWPRREAWEV